MGRHPLGALGLFSQPSKPESTGLGVGGPITSTLPGPAWAPTPAQGPEKGSQPKSGRLEGMNGPSFSFFYFSLISSFVLLVRIQPPDSIMTYIHNISLLFGILLL